MSTLQHNDSTAVESNPDDRWFEIAKAHLANGPSGILRAAIGHAAFTAAMSSSDRVQAADAVATLEAATLGAQSGMLTLLEHLNACEPAERDREIPQLLNVAREASMTDRSLVADHLAAAARDAAIADPFHDEPDDRPSADEILADEHDARVAESEADR